MSQYLLLKHIRVQNANAIASPFTVGFPAVTAFMGFAHALQRHLNPAANPDAVLIQGVGIACHAFTLQDHQDNYSRTLRLTANPLDKDGNRPSFVEEGRCHLTVSLLLEVNHLPNGRDLEHLLERLKPLLMARCKLAGGDILDVGKVLPLKDEKASLRCVMPGYVLMERRDLMQEAMRNGQDALDALHGFLQINHRCERDKEGEDKATWQSHRARAGWLVPIATGFHALSEAGVAEQQRDRDTPHRFAESLVTLGEFIMPYRLDSLAAMIWRYRHDGDFYTCTQQPLQDCKQESDNG